MHRFRLARRCPPAPRAAGFTLIEVMIVLAIVAILAAVAMPSFLGQIRKSKRSDAMEAASRIQQAQERFRVINPTYAANLGALGLPSTTSGGYYTMATAAGAGAAAATQYMVTATANAGTSQAGDSGCTTMTITLNAGVVSYSPALCWGR